MKHHSLRTLAKVLLLCFFAVFLFLCCQAKRLFFMPGDSFSGPLPPLTPRQEALSKRLEQHVQELAGTIKARNIFAGDSLERGRLYIEQVWANGGFDVERQDYKPARAPGLSAQNIWVEIPGTAEEPPLLVGAHYDSADADCPGANDNASGVAALLELSLALRSTNPLRPIRFVAFANEEPPFFQTDDMGSYRYAAMISARKEKLYGVVILESLGNYSDLPGSQRYPAELRTFYPDRGNFLAFIANPASTDLLQRTIGVFRRAEKFPTEGMAGPNFIPGIGFSDHWSFWQFGYQAVMVTDTSFYRDRNYHTANDRPEALNYTSFARVVDGLQAVLGELAGG